MINYILAYYQAITNGSVTVGRYIRKWYQLIVKGLEDKRYFYDPQKAKAAIVFAENYCRHHEGALGGQRVKLELWQKAFLSVVFGIVDENGERYFREVVLIIGRKNGKTLLAAIVAAYCTFLDGEIGARVYFCGTKLAQAKLCFDAFTMIVKQEPRLSAMARKRRSDIYIEATNSSAQPLAFTAKTSDGLNISCAIADEIASWSGQPGIRFYEVLRSSFGARRSPLLVNISTAGYESGGIYDELMKRCTAVLNGTSKETKLAPFIYSIDNVKHWNDVNEVAKANPNLGVSISVDYLLEEIAIAEGSLFKKAEFLVKYCNIKQTGPCAWLSEDAINKARGEPLDPKKYAHSYAAAGIDLSRTTDLTAAAMIVQREDRLAIFSHFWLPAEKLEEATARDKIPYEAMVRHGFLTLSEGNIVDYQDVYRWIDAWAEEKEIIPLVIGYDRAMAAYLISDLKAAGYKVDDCWQGENMTPAINEFEGMLKDGVIDIGDNDLLAIHLRNAGLKINLETERKKLIKIDTTAHVDGVAAILDALIVRQKWWNELGPMLENKR